MINLFKYRKLAILMLIVLIISFILTFVAFWNIILQNSVKNEGWVLIFFGIVFITGVALFLMIFTISDQDKLNSYIEMTLTRDKMTAEDDIKEESAVETTVEILDKDLFSNLAKKLSSPKDLDDLCNNLLKGLTEHVQLVQGIMYVKEKKGKKFNPSGSFALSGNVPEPFSPGEGLAGQAVSDKSAIRINDIPDDYDVSSGLGKSRPNHIIFLPVCYNDSPVALLELGVFKKPDTNTEALLDMFSTEAGKIIHNFYSR